MIFFFCCNRQTLHFSLWSGKMERLLPFSRCNQQFLTHDLNARVVRQLKIVHTSHYRGQEVIGVFRWFECLPDNCQRWIQTPEAWWKGKEERPRNLVSLRDAYGQLRGQHFLSREENQSGIPNTLFCCCCYQKHRTASLYGVSTHTHTRARAHGVLSCLAIKSTHLTCV